tara:strand:- start:2870 stop:3499 length:630 start_codon:yes stop_codon:yes gene_type:complete
MKNCICLMGVDGSGKSTLATEYRKLLSTKGIASILVWSRYRNYLSKPFLAITRLTGHNKKEEINGTKIGYHDFSSSKLISYTFLFFQWLDQFIDIIIRFKFKKQVIVSDRCIIDTLIDLCVDTELDDFIFGRYGKSLIKLMPKNTVYFVVERNKDVVFDMRPDVQVDKNYDRRVELYKRAIINFKLTPVNNNHTIKAAIDFITITINKY